MGEKGGGAHAAADARWPGTKSALGWVKGLEPSAYRATVCRPPVLSESLPGLTTTTPDSSTSSCTGQGVFGNPGAHLLLANMPSELADAVTEAILRIVEGHGDNAARERDREIAREAWRRVRRGRATA